VSRRKTEGERNGTRGDSFSGMTRKHIDFSLGSLNSVGHCRAGARDRKNGKCNTLAKAVETLSI